MFKMPSFIPETPATVKTRPDPPDSARATPSIPKSVSRDSLFVDRDDLCREVYSAAHTASAIAAPRTFDLPEDPSFWKDHNVQVIIRLRPLNNNEISTQGYSRCVKQDSSHTITWTGHPESRFTFDVVADETVTQEQLFKVAGVAMVENCVAGYNSCMFAYGQTGSGKTHTMLGDIENGTRRHSVNSGMTPRVFEYLFSRIQKEKEARREEKFRFTCKCSFLEIYNEQILDLLNPSSANLQIREDLKKGIYVENLTELEVASAREVMQQLLEGSMNRKVAATNMNRASSRSHSVFTCVIESNWESQGVTHHRFARLNLVDLAGSERQKSSGAEGERLKEATNINKSLSTLGLVIMNLVSISNGKSLHVPYRDSKLTFLLQDSLGGNSKTTIVANISPSSSCSLETLSTLKFAQRAKFIKNNAIINEDASGDVLAMRMQIQQLKKEVSHLRSLANGGSGNHENEVLPMNLLGSPGPFKWAGLNGSFSPLATDKSLAQRKEYEVALVGAFRREKDKDLELQALTAETQAAMQLAKQREDEIQSLKMRLGFREAGIKRLEAVASGKISAEVHLLKEKEEHLREIEVLRAQVDRNQEVTRFAMENLRLKEEIRRLKSLCEEGERERMNEQITTLQNKLLEALDWKLMHESDPSNFQKQSPGLLTYSQSDSEQLPKNKESSTPPLQPFIKEENEFLRMQAIHNQSEIDSLRKKLDSYLEEKENFERHIKELEKDLVQVRFAMDTKEEMGSLQPEEISDATNDVDKMLFHDQLELKAMVDAIAAASQREAEAHEMAITLGKENDELRAKIKVLIEDNSKLIELYERAVSENKARVNTLDDGSGNNDAQSETETVSLMEASHTKDVSDLEHQLVDLHEENEKLMSLYEKAMVERDDLKRMLSSALHNTTTESRELECLEKLLVVDDGKSSRFSQVSADSSSMDLDEELFSAEAQIFKEDKKLQCDIQITSDQFPSIPLVVGEAAVQISLTSNDLVVGASLNTKTPSKFSFEGQGDDQVSDNPSACMAELDIHDTTVECPANYQALSCQESVMLEEHVLLRAELDRAREKISSCSHTVNELAAIEKAILGFDEFSKEIEVVKAALKFKQQEIDSLVTLYSDVLARRILVDKKLTSMKVSLSNFCSSIAFFEQREGRAKARLDASVSSFNQKKENLAQLTGQRDQITAKKREIQIKDAEIRNNLVCMKANLEEENQRQDHEKVLFSIDNIERNEVLPVQNNWRSSSKATDLLKSEEEKTKLQNEIKQSREELSAIKKDLEGLNLKSQKLNNEIPVVSAEMQKAAKAVQETELALQNVSSEKEALVNVIEDGKFKIDNLIAAYQLCIFEDCFREEELNIVGEDMHTKLLMLDILESERANIITTATQLLQKSECQTVLPSDNMRQELKDVQNLIQAAISISVCREVE